MAEKQQIVFAKGVVINVDISNTEAWSGGKKWAPGSYAWQLMGVGSDQKSIVFNLKCLKSPDGREGEFFKFYRTVSEDKARNYYHGFVRDLCPAAAEDALCSIQNGRKMVNSALLDGGVTGEGVIFTADLAERTYEDEEGKSHTVADLQQFTINVLRESTYMQSLRLNPQWQQFLAKFPAPTGTGASATSAQSQAAPPPAAPPTAPQNGQTANTAFLPAGMVG